MTKVVILGNGLVGNSVYSFMQKSTRYETFSLSRSDLNLTDALALEAQFVSTRPEVVVIAAGVVGGIERNKADSYNLGLENARILTSIINVCNKLDIEHVINLVPACVYPSNLSRRMRPSDLWTGPMESSSLAYSTSKLLGMVLLEAARIQFGREWISLISTNVYGKSRLRSADEEHVIPALLRKFHDAKSSQSNTVTLLGDGSPIREFLHADDLASAIHFVVNNHLYENPVLNVSSHDPCTIRDLAEIIKKITGFQGIYNFSGLIGNGAEIKLLDGSQLHDYGWSPEVSLQDGICDVYRTGLL